MHKSELGLVHVYTGDGKGKTTASVGLGVRCSGREKYVAMFQFLKNTPSSELYSIKKLDPYFKVFRNEKFAQKFIEEMNEAEARNMQKAMLNLFDDAMSYMRNEKCDLIILDEIFVCIKYKIISENILISLIKNKPAHIELVLTGRGASERIMSMADYVTEMKCLKHPYEKGISFRDGIEQ